MNLGVETHPGPQRRLAILTFQHSLMNLGVETVLPPQNQQNICQVSAFSDESWGGDRNRYKIRVIEAEVSAFSDESWGGDRTVHCAGGR